MDSRITLKHPSKTDRDPSRLLLVSNLDERWLEPQGLFLSEEVLQQQGRALGPFGLAVYVAWQFLAYVGQEPSVATVAAYLGCQKVTVKKQALRLQDLGLLEDQE